MLFIDSVKCLLAAARALEVLNFMPLNGKTIRIMHSNRDPSTRRSGSANIFIKVVRDKNGVSKGSGFVVFQSPEHASRAVSRISLVACLFFCQAQFSQMRPVVMPPSVAPRVPLYPPSAPGLGQPLFYGQPPALVPPQVASITQNKVRMLCGESCF
ncbi:hypothetical protein GW17_00056495 [Ensete ventricosum]|uniref:Uncharacterized protein n=1 Tax=Ensete ventricosum TaxID=4639 RepID=A0A444C828_ENSVE|nr:hypothetical protein B296_00043092 [Ensete ventricosum]RWV82037.1 hypothetical protein GW17_00056495 [Ensete ventricosum]